VTIDSVFVKGSAKETHALWRTVADRPRDGFRKQPAWCTRPRPTVGFPRLHAGGADADRHHHCAGEIDFGEQAAQV
jgi:hypothetical protein